MSNNSTRWLQERASSPSQMVSLAFLSHLVQHLYIGAAPLLFPLIMTDLKLTYFQIGLIIAVRTFFAGFCQLFFGFLRQVLNIKKILIASNLLSALSSIGLGVSGNFHSFLLCNSLWGISTSPVHPAGGALIADSSKNKSGKTNIGIGMFYSFAYFGNILGIILVILFVSSFTWRGIFFIMGLLGILVTIYGFFIPDIRKEIPRQASVELKKALKDNRVILMCLIGISLFGGSNVFIRHMAPLYLTNQLHLPVEYAGLIFILMSIIGIFFPTIFAWLSSKCKNETILTFIALLLAILFLIIVNQSKTEYVVVILSLQALLAWPLLALLQASLVNSVEHSVKSAGSDIFLTVSVCSFILWSSIFGYLIDLSGSFNWTFYLISALCIGSIPLILIMDKWNKRLT